MSSRDHQKHRDRRKKATSYKDYGKQFFFFPLKMKKQCPPQTKSLVTMQNVIIHQAGIVFCLRMKSTHAVFSG